MSIPGDILMVKYVCHVPVEITVTEWSLRIHSREPIVDVLADV